MNNQRSRLKQRLENKMKTNLVLSLLGTLIIVGALLKYGIPILVNTTLFLSGNKKDTGISKKSNSNAFVSAPVLDSTYSATNSAVVTVKGSGLEKQEISLYVNDELIDKTKTKENGSFSFEDVRLKKGENTIHSIATNENNSESSPSNNIIIVYKDTPPALSIDSPNDGQSFSKDDNKASVTGKTDPGTKVTVNDFWAIVESDGHYSYTLPLKNGDNQIKVVATDEAGNQTTTERKVTYSQ